MRATGLTARPCPVCGSSKADLLYRQRFASFAKGSLGDGYDVVACGDCGMCFASGLPDEQRLSQYYADSSKYDLGAEGASLSTRDLQRHASQAAFIAAHLLDRDIRVLDVGTATGDFLVALRDLGFERLYGVDPSPEAVRFAHDELSLDVAVGGLDDVDRWGKFDLISYVMVLEHLLDPRQHLRAVARRLRPDGHVFISVPDAGAFKDHVDAPYQEFSVEHINFFTKRSLANAMAAEGYALVAERSVLVPLGADGEASALEAIYRFDGVVRSAQRDDFGAADIAEYIARCERSEAAVRDQIASLAVSGESIYVWGTGTHTLHLMETSRLADCRIEAFLDSNPHYAGATLGGRPVMSPADLPMPNSPILVSSAVSQAAIASAARERFGDDVQLILLYRGGNGPD